MSKNKKLIIGILIILYIIIIGIFIIYKVVEKSVKDRENFNFEVEDISSNPVDTKNSKNNESKVDDIMENVTSINVSINNKIYNATIENNETATTFINMLPQEYNMNELNGNEKYIYLDETFATNSYNPKHIEKGDIMLYGNNCLVVFYNSFDTSYSYTKIGHIENLPDLESDNVIIKFER